MKNKENNQITITSFTSTLDESGVFRVTRTSIPTKSSAVGDRMRSLKEKNSLKKNVVIQDYAELNCGTFVKITHKKGDMYCGDVVKEYNDEPGGSVYFSKDYVKTFEQIPIIIGKN
jgi:hypothetical protein